MTMMNQIPQITQDFAELKALLFETVITLKAKRVLEIGTDVGDSTRIFATALRETHGHLWTIDHLPPKWPEGWLIPYPNVTLLTTDSLILPWEMTVDLLFLDGSHESHHVLQELQKFGPWVHQGGQILLHDTCHAEFGTGILQAIQTFTGTYHLPWHNHQIQHGLGVIEIIHEISH